MLFTTSWRMLLKVILNNYFLLFKFFSKLVFGWLHNILWKNNLRKREQAIARNGERRGSVAALKGLPELRRAASAPPQHLPHMKIFLAWDYLVVLGAMRNPWSVGMFSLWTFQAESKVHVALGSRSCHSDAVTLTTLCRVVLWFWPF